MRERGVSSFAGMNVFVSRATTKMVARSWRERLFTRPWRPLETAKVVVIPAAVPTGECYRIGDALHCGEQFYEELKRQTRPARVDAVFARHAREGFPDLTAPEFISFFCDGHKGCTPNSIITRIEFVKIGASSGKGD
jgi:hypothetical protein